MPSQTPKPRSHQCPKSARARATCGSPRNVFRERFRERFYDPAFEQANAEIEKVIDIAWQRLQRVS